MYWPFRKKLNYEKELPALAADIRKSQLQLTGIQAQKRRVSGVFFIYSSIICLGYAIAVAFVPGLNSKAHLIAVIGLPLLLIALKKVINKVYTWRLNRQQTYLDAQVQRRNVLVEEYKERTNYYKIKQLVDFPDSPDSPDSDALEKVGAPAHPAEPGEGDPRHQSELGPPAIETVAPPLAPPLAPYPVSVAPQKLTWMDRLLDMIVGENEESPNNRFALICKNCHNHNGLATYGKAPETVVYRCPICGFLNGTPAGDEEVNTEDTSEERKRKLDTIDSTK